MGLETQSTMAPDLLLPFFEAEGLIFLGAADVEETRRGPKGEQARQEYRSALDQGHFGTMDYLRRHEPMKYDPGTLLEGTKAILVVGLPYFQVRPPLPPAAGLVARYAWGRDYHKVFLGKIQRVVGALAEGWPGHRWRSFTDTAPLDERWWAAQAGASFTARNSLAIHRSLGSWFFLGEILTTLPIIGSTSKPHAHGGCPSGCQRCRRVCPTGALDENGRIEAHRCLSYLTIEHRGPIDDPWKPLVGSWLFGCDLCQEVCPLNLKVVPTAEPEFLAWKAGPHLDLADVLALDDQGFTRRFGGSPVHRTGRAGLVRNACLVAANLKRTELLAPLGALRNDPDPGVADAATWAVTQLEKEDLS